MNSFDTAYYAELVAEAQDNETFWEREGHAYGSEINAAAATKDALSLTTASQKFCRDNGFGGCSEIAEESARHLRQRSVSTLPALATEMRHLKNALIREARLRHFLLVQWDRANIVDQDALFGPDVYRVFRFARFDIKEAGNCLGAECNTAAVFHLMRAVEWGLRALCVHVGLRKAKSTTKSGKKAYTPISYVDWETMLNQLHPRVDAKINKLKRGTAKQKAQEFYYPVLQDIRGIRDAWRNHLMHTRAEYSRTNAAAIYEHVRRLMVALSQRVSEA